MSIAPLLHEQIEKSPCGTAAAISSSCESSFIDIAQRLFLSPGQDSYQTIAFISSRSDRNVSFLCANLACVLGPLHGRVLVLNEVQLLEAASELRFKEINFNKAEESEIWLAPQRRPRASSRPASSALKGLLSLKQEFDFIVVDAGLRLRDFPSHELINSVDGFVLVVTEDETEIGELINIRKKIIKAGGKIIGAIYCGSSQEEK